MGVVRFLLCCSTCCLEGGPLLVADVALFAVTGWLINGVVFFLVTGWFIDGVVLFSVTGRLINGVVLFSTVGWLLDISSASELSDPAARFRCLRFLI